MIPELAAALPTSLAAFAPRLAIGAAQGRLRASDIVGGREAYAQATAPFARTFPAADERAVLSYWSQHYFAALIIPVLAAAVRLHRVLPLALDAVECELGETGLVDRFWLRHEGATTPSQALEAGLETLVCDHLRPFVDSCSRWSGLSRRVLWCNAGTVLDFAVRELDIASSFAGKLEQQRMTAHRPGKASRALAAAPRQEMAELFAPFRTATSTSERKRRVCCLRLRLPGVDCCGAICPLRPKLRLAVPDPRTSA